MQSSVGTSSIGQVHLKNFRKSRNEAFNLYPSEYISAPIERLGGYFAKNKLAISNVCLLFLINNEREHPLCLKKQYQAPQHVVYEKPWKYNELQYPIELRMEFYIKVLDPSCKPGDSVFELFVGTKLLVASIVSIACAYSLAQLELNSLLL